MNKFKLPEDVRYILEKLNNNGFESYIVGGCVRDMIIGVEPYDWDITTDALPNDVKKIFKNTVDTGIKHGTVSIIIKSKLYEVTTYRIDGEYLDSRRPESITFTNKLEEDLLRRDFTINAIAYNEKYGIQDPYKGVEDINKKIIKCVGNAENRFEEDALRILRAVRFSSKLGFDIENKTYKAMKKLSNKLANISKERIREEFSKTLNSNNPEKLNLIKEINAESHIFMKNISYYIDTDIKNKILSTDDSNIKLAVLFYLVNMNSYSILRYLKYDNKTLNEVEKMIDSCKYEFYPENVFIIKMLKLYDIELTKKIIIFNIILGRISDDYINRFNRVLNLKPIYTREQLEINGNDLINLGIKGKKIGQLLNYLLDSVIMNQSLNTKDALIDLIYSIEGGSNDSNDNKQC